MDVQADLEPIITVFAEGIITQSLSFINCTFKYVNELTISIYQNEVMQMYPLDLNNINSSLYTLQSSWRSVSAYELSQPSSYLFPTFQILQSIALKCVAPFIKYNL